jgi:hypothetical protein
MGAAHDAVPLVGVNRGAAFVAGEHRLRCSGTRIGWRYRGTEIRRGHRGTEIGRWRHLAEIRWRGHRARIVGLARPVAVIWKAHHWLAS